MVFVTWTADTVLLLVTADLAPPGELGPWFQSLEDFAFVLAGSLGLMLVLRQPGNAVGWWLMVAGISFPLEGFAFELTEYLHHLLGPTPAVLVVSWFPRWVWVLSAINLPFLLLYYPDGRVASPRWRSAVWSMAALTAGLFFLAAFLPIPMEELGDLANPLGLAWVGAVGDVAIGVVTGLIQVVVPALATISLVQRFRRGGPVERQQLKVLLWVGVVVVAFFAGHSVARDIPDWLNALGNIALTVFIAGAFALAILRYRLFDIDRLISRTLSYALVAVVIAVVYGFGAVWLPTRLVGEQAPLFVAGSTLAVAALFNPLRRQVMTAVDRRFHRSRYDTDRVVEAFASRLRDQVDVGELRAEFAGVVEMTLRPSRVAVWVRGEP